MNFWAYVNLLFPDAWSAWGGVTVGLAVVMVTIHFVEKHFKRETKKEKEMYHATSEEKQSLLSKTLDAIGFVATAMLQRDSHVNTDSMAMKVIVRNTERKREKG